MKTLSLLVIEFTLLACALLSFAAEPSDPLQPIPPPWEYDIMAEDLTSETLKLIANETNILHNQATDHKASYPVKGIVYGENERILFPLIIEYGLSRRTQALFLYESSSPYNFISYETFDAVGVQRILIPSKAQKNMNVHGTAVKVSPSINHFQAVNVIGQNFLRDHKLEVTVDYKRKTAQLKKKWFVGNGVLAHGEQPEPESNSSE